MPALICGSLAFDTITTFPGRFAEQIMPDQVHILNVSFLVPTLRREWGGCAGNIAYNLHGLGGAPVILGAVGVDGDEYLARVRGWGADTSLILRDGVLHTAQCHITTDRDNNQITAFHPGAMSHAHLMAVPPKHERGDLAIGIIAPDGRDAMWQHAHQMHEQGIPFIFDPGQGMPMFGDDDLRRFISQARWVTLNDYEWELLQQKTGLSVTEVTAQVEALVVTQGAEGSVIYTKELKLKIPSAKPRAVVDPTGCGDAYRAGLIHGLLEGLDWETIGRMASLMGAIKIESRGPQNHVFTQAEFKRRYQDNFG